MLPAKEIEDRFQRSFLGSTFPRTSFGARVKCPIRGMNKAFRVDSTDRIQPNSVDIVRDIDSKAGGVVSAGRGEDGIVLEKEAKALLLPALEELLETPIRWAVRSGRTKKTRQIKRRDCIQAEAHTLANRLLGKDGGLPEVMETREVFGEENGGSDEI